MIAQNTFSPAHATTIMDEPRPASRSRPSIADVARLANVSISTVSRVVNRSELVNLQTRTRVEEAIRKLGYQPNAFARGLMLQRSQILALVLPDLHGEFYSEIIRGANLQARENGYSLIVAAVAGPGDDGQTSLELVGQQSLLDGMAVMLSEARNDAPALLAGLQRPYVVLDDEIPGFAHDSVIIDQAAGTTSLMRHLLEKHQIERIIFVGGPKTNVDTVARQQACQAALQHAGRTLAPDDIYHLDYEYETANTLGIENMQRWASSQVRTCVFAANDEMAAGILAAAATSGVRVPQDVAVAGFDDTRVARMTQPPLTTVRVPMSEMGARAIELLSQRIAEPERPPTRIMLQPQLIVRESCGCGR